MSKQLFYDVCKELNINADEYFNIHELSKKPLENSGRYKCTYNRHKYNTPFVVLFSKEDSIWIVWNTNKPVKRSNFSIKASCVKSALEEGSRKGYKYCGTPERDREMVYIFPVSQTKECIEAVMATLNSEK